LVLAQESGNWPRLKELAGQLNVDEERVSCLYWQSAVWAKEACQP
jgi:hypothetical protein